MFEKSLTTRFLAQARDFDVSGCSPEDSRYKLMIPPSLRNRIRNGTLGMLFIAVTMVALALPEVHHLGGAIRRTLYRNYLSIEAAQHMHSALWNLQLAAHDGHSAAVLPTGLRQFTHWIRVERNDVTGIGEGALAKE